MKKSLIMIVIFGMILGLFTACHTVNPSEKISTTVSEEPSSESPANEPTQKTLDIILVAGQSNATGTTKVDYTAAYEILPELKTTGYPNVLTAGELRTTDSSYSEGFYRRNINWQTTMLGLGKNGKYMGPEVGIAKELSAFCNGESGMTAGILKYGHGGTAMLNTTSGSSRYGNWVSPSYAQKKGYSYQGATGGLYREFLQVVRKKLESLPRGYTDFNIRGLYWLQGEEDRENPQEYKQAFLCFAQDLRRDLSDIVKEITGDDDRGAADMPIWVGTISRTFRSANSDDRNTNAAFIQMQKGLADEQNKIFVVDNSEYDINRMENGSSVPVGADIYHWNQADHISIGRNVGRAILKYYNMIE